MPTHALPPIVHRTKPSRSRMNHTPARASARKLRSASRSQLEGGPETEPAVRSGWMLSALTSAPGGEGHVRRSHWMLADALRTAATTVSGSGMYPMLAAIFWPSVRQYSTIWRRDAAFLGSLFSL